MNIEDKYKSYFSSRGVDPSIYKNARLPYFKKESRFLILVAALVKICMLY